MFKSFSKKKRPESPFSNNDDPTPRHAPTRLEAENERISLQEEAALGAGLPGYHTKQQQTPPQRTESGSSSPFSPAMDAGGSASDGGDEGDADPPWVGASHEDSQGNSADHDGGGGRKQSFNRSFNRVARASKEGEDGGGDNEQGVWNGLLSMFRFDPKRKQSEANLSLHGRTSFVGAPSAGPASGGPALPDPHDLPNPGISLAVPHVREEESDSFLLSDRTRDEGRRGARKSSVLSPRGTPPTTAASGETADEERMRSYLQVRPADHTCMRAGR